MEEVTENHTGKIPQILFICYYYFKYIYFWLCWVFVAVCGLSLVVVSRLLIAVASLVAEHRP